MQILFLDLEWGQIYGSYRRDFFPLEVGAVIARTENGRICFNSKRFDYDIDVVIRKNKLNAVAKTIGFSEVVANIAKREYQKPFDPTYRLPKQDKIITRKLLWRSLGELRLVLQSLLQQHEIKKVVLFGGNEDLNLLQQARVDLSHIEVIDIQRLIRKSTGHLFSLDKMAFILSFYANDTHFGSKNFRYTIPKKYKYLIKPHRAIGDACRIFAVYQEFDRGSAEFIQQCHHYLQPKTKE